MYIYMHHWTSYACNPVPHGDRSTIVESKRTLEFKWHRLVLFFKRHLHFYNRIIGPSGSTNLNASDKRLDYKPKARKAK